VTITLVRQAADKTFGSTLTTTLTGTPAEGNLLVAVANGRSGETAYTMTSSGWTAVPAATVYFSVADSTFRKAHATWVKIAGASEPAAVEIGGANGATTLSVAEFTGSSAELDAIAATIASLPAVGTGSDAVASFYGSGTSPAVTATEKLLIGHAYTKTGSSATEQPYSTWSAGADPITEFAEYSDGTNGLDHSWAWGTSTNSGTNAVRADKDPGSTDAERGAIVSLLVFALATAPPTPAFAGDAFDSGAFETATGGPLARSTAETTSTTDASSRSIALARAAGETTAAADTASRTVSRARAAGETTSTVDVTAAAVTRTIPRAGAETTTTSDSTARGAQVLGRSTSESTTTADQAARTTSRARTAAESTSTADTSTRTVARARSAAETTTTSDATSGSRTGAPRIRSTAETTSTTDTSSASTTGMLSRATSEATTAGDASSRRLTLQRPRAETTSTSDQVGRRTTSSRLQLETTSTGDLTAAASSTSRTILEQLVTEDATSATMGLPPIDVRVLRTGGRQRSVAVNGRDPYHPATGRQRDVDVTSRRRIFSWSSRRPTT
jgi:hypothetical protein